ncbi:MAG: hypothetical protein EZS28_021871 [Streblomastix strix]|uniref:Uncharacterized protein n=1 Tax=Streblomastix strix TaxID=222440 RepID=A0A5J4VK54_9EUKA|nr:MAG: hypothetical protein EZS28_021871 [Streblomastix strix]
MPGDLDVSTDRHDGSRKFTENTTVTSYTSSIQQLEAEVAMSIVPDRGSTSGFGRYIIDKNYRHLERTASRTKGTDCETRNIFDQEYVGDNATRMGSGSSQKTDSKNSTDCVFTTTESITTVEPEHIQITQSLLTINPYNSKCMDNSYFNTPSHILSNQYST